MKKEAKRIFKKRGFTLIELLVVIAIIGILSTIVLSFLNPARLKSRNARRISDIHTLVTAFNLSFINNGFFPNTGNSDACISETCYGGWNNVSNPTVDAFLAPSLSQKPSDPTGGNRGLGGYLYGNPKTYYGYPTGAWIHYFIEVPGSCGEGLLFETTSNYKVCILQL